MSNILPLFQYPTTFVWVDDDELFLEIIKLEFCNGETRKMFNHPKGCLDFFTTYKNPLSQIAFLYAEHDRENYCLLEHAPVDLDVTGIAKLRECPERSQEVSVVICDHNMPEISGLELCRNLQRRPLKKILLTGELGDHDGVHALNGAMVDRFLRKDDLDLGENLKRYTKKLERQYFCELTSALLSHLEADYYLPLSDPVFISFFDQWCEENRINEFYLIDKQGSFLTVDDKDDVHYFVVHTDRSLEQFSQIYSDNSEVSLLTSSVKEHRKIPFFGYGKDAWQVESKEWEQHFYVPRVFVGREAYYWVVV